jgi:MoaA/NifB/PqqE/SkfB family radical SAM enzyme
MTEKLAEMPFLRNIGLLMTYKCQVACPHCIIEAGPHRKEQVRLDDAFQWIRQAAGYRDGYIRVLSLTGGEPFYDLAHLKSISDFGAACGLFVSAVTNAFWALTEKAAIEILRELDALKMLQISTDVYHQVSIPFERVKNAVYAAKACGVPYTVAVCTENTKDRGYLQVLDQLREITEKESIFTAITFQAGRAVKNHLQYQTSEVPPVSACSAGSSPIVFPDGRVIACIGPVIDLPSAHPLVLGDLREESLSEILDRAERNPILHAIRIWGPRRLISMAKDAGLGPYLPQTYVEGSVCHACYELMAESRIVGFMAELAQDFEFQRRVAYARVYYLREPQMVECLGLTG